MTTTVTAPPHGPAPVLVPQQTTAPIRHRPRLRRVCYEPGAATADADPPAPAAPLPEPPVDATAAELAEAGSAAARVLRLALEVLDGQRLLAHLAGHLDERMLRYWRVKVEQRQVRTPARFTRMRICLPLPGIAEVAVACSIDGSVRAIAARFERRAPARWQCTELRLG